VQKRFTIVDQKAMREELSGFISARKAIGHTGEGRTLGGKMMPGRIGGNPKKG